MGERTLWDQFRDWASHLPLRLAFRIVWLCARLNLGSARDVYRAMWDANLDLPRIAALSGSDPRG